MWDLGGGRERQECAEVAGSVRASRPVLCYLPPLGERESSSAQSCEPRVFLNQVLLHVGV